MSSSHLPLLLTWKAFCYSFLPEFFVVWNIIHKMKIFYICKSRIILDNPSLSMTIQFN